MHEPDGNDFRSNQQLTQARGYDQRKRLISHLVTIPINGHFPAPGGAACARLHPRLSSIYFSFQASNRTGT